MRRILFLLTLSLLAAAGCGRGTPADPDATEVEPDADTSADARPVVPPSKVYAHSGTRLYQIDTTDLDVVEIGAFGAALGNSSITDIAVDKNDRMIGITLGKIFEIDVETGVATHLADYAGAGNMSSLSFVPVDPADEDSAERLVAASSQGNVVEIFPDSGMVEPRGNYGLQGTEQIGSSGDIVSVRGFGTLATVDIGVSGPTDFDDDDFLATIDPETWVATPIGTASTGYDRIFGLGFWGGTIFGFVDDGQVAGTGQLITIDPVTGVGSPAQVSNFRWYGAGVTTKAPIVD